MNETYQKFNEALAGTLMSPKNRSSSRLLEGEDFSGKDNTAPTGQGSLVVQVTLAKGAIPVSGARVTVSTAGNQSTQIADLLTDESGRTAPLLLPAPQSSYSQTPDSVVRPYSNYNIKVEYKGYYTEDAVNVPIFDKINSIQPVSLIPLSERDAGQFDIVVDEDTTDAR